MRPPVGYSRKEVVSFRAVVGSGTQDGRAREITREATTDGIDETAMNGATCEPLFPDSLRRLDLLVGGLCLSDERGECGGVVDGDVGEDLAIEFNAGFFQAVDED
jgi:hypothetical protein